MFNAGQFIALCEILETPFISEAYHYMDRDHLAVAKTQQQSPEWQAIARLRDYLAANIYPELQAELRLAGYIAEWDSLGTNPVRMDGGGAASVSGITIDPDAQRRTIQSRVRAIVPFFRAHQTIETVPMQHLTIDACR